MFTFLTIGFIVLFVSYRYMKQKALSDFSTDTMPESSQNPFPEFEHDSFPESDFAPFAKPDAEPFQDFTTDDVPSSDTNVAQTSYFSYENDSSSSSSVRPQHTIRTMRTPSGSSQPVSASLQHPSSDLDLSSFDLRQAVIASTILNNDYINDRF